MVMIMSVCLTTRITRKPHTELYQILCMLFVAAARCCTDGVAIRYVFPVLWITSCFHTMGPTVRIKYDVMFRRSSPGGGAKFDVIQLQRLVEFITM